MLHKVLWLINWVIYRGVKQSIAGLGNLLSMVGKVRKRKNYDYNNEEAAVTAYATYAPEGMKSKQMCKDMNM